MQGNLQSKVGVDDAEGTPVPIPNTEVKLSSAEDTWLVTARENRKTPTFVYFIPLFAYINTDSKIQIYRYSSIAQSVERMTVNHDVTGSSPVGGAKREQFLTALFFVVQQIIKMIAVIVIYEVQLCSQVYIRLYVNSWGKTVKRKLIKTSGDNQVATCF